MAVELTNDERAKVEVARLAPRPEFFNAESVQKVQISADFEAFLILQDEDTIQAAIDWLTDTNDLAESRIDRDAVAFEALVSDINDRETKQSEVSDLTSTFNEWREKFQAGKFSDVSEVGLIIRDMQATAEELFVLEERMSHLEAVQNRVGDRIRSGISKAQLRELQSWPTPLLAY